MEALRNGPAGAHIVARDLALSYDGRTVALGGVTCELAAGDLVVLLGPNGGGKTTLFRALTGELEPIGGALAVTGRIALLAQTDRTRLDYPVSALDVALMGTLSAGRWWRRPGRDARTAARKALARVGLAGREQTLFGELSGGQRRRVLIARALVQDAAVVVLDEPLAGVDPGSAQIIQTVLEGLRDDGRLVLVASHDIDHARAADRVLCVNRRQIAFGRPDEVLTEETLRATYEAEMTVIEAADGERVVTTAQHHDHAH